MEQIIKVDEEVVADIQAKDISAKTAEDIIAKMIDQHQLDTDTSFMKSPVFREYQKEATAKRLEWERAKDAMALKFIPEKLSDKVKSWNLNYGTNELTLTL